MGIFRSTPSPTALPRSVRLHYKEQVQSLDGVLVHVDADHYVLQSPVLIDVASDGSPTGQLKTVQRQFTNPSIWVQRRDVLLVEVKP